MTKGRDHINCPKLSTPGGEGQNWVKFGPRTLEYLLSEQDVISEQGGAKNLFST